MASEFTKQANAKVFSELDFNDKRDFENAERGFIATYPDEYIPGKDYNSMCYNFKMTEFLDKECPETVNPSLWRQCQLNKKHGLFEVIKGKLYQIRGFDIANMSFIRGKSGWIVVDCTCTNEAAAAGLALLKKHIEDIPVSAVIITHSHGDHVGGYAGVSDGSVKVYQPKNCLKELVEENLLTGNAMDRRSIFMYGQNLPINPLGMVGCGLGHQLSHGVNSFHNQSSCIEVEGEKELEVDGIKIQFIETPGAEAPSEFVFYIPEFKAFCQAEEVNHLMHNLVTLRGAKVRSGQLWSYYIDQIIEKFGDDVEISFGSHNWPVWGNKEIVEFWEKQRDLYKFVHDQTIRYINMGYTPNEIPTLVKLPKSLEKEFYCRGYYGTLSHNIKAQYQLYLGFYDGNPASLDPLAPEEMGKKYLECFGEEKLIEIGKKAYTDGEYRWGVEVLNHVIFGNPKNVEARKVLADIYTQLGYAQESAVWRNIYLTGAFEIMGEKAKEFKANNTENLSIIVALTCPQLFEVMSTNIVPERIVDQSMIINFTFVDTKEVVCLVVKNCVVNVRTTLSKKANVSLTLTKMVLLGVIAKKVELKGLVMSGKVKCEGDPSCLMRLFGSVSTPERIFNIVEP
ncbi:hypothetical protein EIN_249120 [Entamoeba invadens IP1]|uniref:Metallo-beta-lactamase domain-containing protein n=1 Tax=Entamoeba invadens IP1 TaxID=370355 RepID=A0A0A1UEG7_ENTIV|nr:hypothetical protein EIN_249120 [Entamoeba invadens IP1]ELP94878.1 hypothetical protein EIN_249120 [Entamoeba invadens IP1]|eukprot:XP_004261649.1 hypothetical protein EIN_249120 [Entamoeba invadens IP1]